MSYTVLARRYRPETFDEVVGQEALARTLKNAIAADRVAHAYLFTGTRGVGKTTMARILAKALNCLAVDEPTQTPCCKCESCIAISEGNDIDVLEIDGASNTSVEHVRELRQNAIYRPARSRLKIYIIDEVHMLSVSAFNALLKTLEEPPDHVKFIFATTEPNKILPTILSRCQRFDFRNVPTEDIAAHLQSVLDSEGIPADPAAVRRISRLARGSVRDSLSLLDQLLSMCQGELTTDVIAELMGAPRSEQIVALVAAMAQNDLKNTLIQCDQALAEGFAMERLAQALQDHFRDLLLVRSCGADVELLDVDDQETRGRLAEQAQLFDESALVYAITVLEELRRGLKSGWTSRALLEAALVRLTSTDRFADTRALLDQLQRGGGPAGAPTAQPAAPGRTPTPPSPSRPSATPARPAAQPPQSSAPAPAPAPASPASVKLNIDSLQALQQQWPAVLEALAQKGLRQIAGYLKVARPADWTDNQLTVMFEERSQSVANYLQSQKPTVAEAEQALSALLGKTIKLNITCGGSNGGSLFAPGAKPSQKEIEAARNDPSVQKVQEIFGGKVLQVDRNKQGQ